MGWAWCPMAGGSLGEDRPLECTIKPDERTFELADDALAITLRIRLRRKRKRLRNVNTDQIYVRLLLQLHKNNDLVVLCMVKRELDTRTAPATKPRGHTFKNMRSSDDWATQSWTAVHFPMPPLAANLVQRASS